MADQRNSTSPDPDGARQGAAWSTPGYEVIETSLEVTMYLGPKL